MSRIEFKNGSKIHMVEADKVIRGKRADNYNDILDEYCEKEFKDYILTYLRAEE